MRILFLADAVFADLPGGSRVVAREMANQLAKAGHEVTFLVARQNADVPDDELVAPGIRVVRYEGAGQPLQFIRQGQRRSAALVKEAPFDIVHTHFAYASIGPLRAIPKSVPRVRTFHGPWDEEAWFEISSSSRSLPVLVKGRLKSLACRAIEKWSLVNSAHVVTLSEHFRAKVTDCYDCPANRVQVVAGGVDTTRFSVGDRSGARAKLGLPGDRRILLTVRRLAKRMGLDNLLKSLPDVIARYPDTLLLIGGSGPERDKLNALVQELGLTDHVRMVGFIAESDLADYYRAADLFVLPTASLEGFGLVTAEALACGTPVIGTPVGATPEILRAIDSRLISASASPTDLAAAITAFFDGGWSAQLMPERLAQHIADNYSWERHTHLIEQIYKSLMPISSGRQSATPATLGCQ